MPEYRLSLDFTAADAAQAERLAEAWAGTCAAEYGTRFAGLRALTATGPCLPSLGETCGSCWRCAPIEPTDDPSASESYGASNE